MKNNRADTKLFQTSYDEALGPDLIATLTDLKAVYDSLDVKRTESGIKAKRDFWKWLKDAFESPGLKIRSPVFNSVSFVLRQEG